MPDSQGQETWRIAQMACVGYQFNTMTVSANATAVSFVQFDAIVNGKWQAIAASTALLVGTVATNCTGMYIMTLGVAGTVSNVLIQTAASASIGSIAVPAVNVTQMFLGGVVRVAATATAFNGSTNSLADGAYTVSFVNSTGVTGMAYATESFTLVPG
jgi:hypothetical protein